MIALSDTETNVAISSVKDERLEIGLFRDDVLRGLQSNPKFLQSKYFYDAAGDTIFQQIMNCQEYYPFRCELEIFKDKTAELAMAILAPGGAFDLIELGAGDCTKSSYLLEYLVQAGSDFTYMPIDISSNMISYLNVQLPLKIPGLKIKGLQGEYLDMLSKAAHVSKRRKVVLFLGSNLGNMPAAEGEKFCRALRAQLSSGDLAVIGLDLKKSPQMVLAAYNDKQGITSRFNLNLLVRINRELGADFDVSQFQHYPVYDPQNGSCKSYLVSLLNQKVSLPVNGVNETICFEKYETVYMEISQKYTVDQIIKLGNQASFETVDSFFDRQYWFIDTIWSAI